MDPIAIHISNNNEDLNNSIQVCRACLLTDCKLFPIHKQKLVQVFIEMTGTTLKKTDKLPQGFCIECLTYLAKFKKFQTKARKARQVLDSILKADRMISLHAIHSIVKVFNRLSVKHFGPDHFDTSCVENVDVKIDSDHDNIKLCNTIGDIVKIKVIPNNLFVIGHDDKESDEREMASIAETNNKYEKSTIEYTETIENVQLIGDAAIIKHEPSVESFVTKENYDTSEEYENYDNQSDFESDLESGPPCNSKVAMGMKRRRKSSTENLMDEVENLLKKSKYKFVNEKKKVTDRKRIHSKESNEKKVASMAKTDNKCEKETIEDIETIEKVQLIEDVAIIKHELTEEYDSYNDQPDFESDLESVPSSNSKVIMGMKRRRKSSTEDLIDEIEILLKKNNQKSKLPNEKKKAKDQKKITSNKENDEIKVASITVTDNECEKETIENKETIEDTETIKEDQLIEDVAELTDESLETIENFEISEKYDNYGNQSRRNSNEEPMDEVKNLLEKSNHKSKDEQANGKKKMKDRKRVTLSSTILGPIKTDSTLNLNDYFTLKILSTEEQLMEMEKRKLKKRNSKCTLKCELCYKEFSDDSTYKLHMANHSEERGPYICEVCKYRYSSSSKLRNHLLISHLRLYSCKKCSHQTKSPSAAAAHARLHRGKVFECKTCKTKYRTLQTYLSHMRLSHPSGHVCGLCACTFINERGLGSHQRIKHALDYRPVPADGPVCDTCGAQFVSQEVLARHQWTSHKEKCILLRRVGQMQPAKPRVVGQLKCPECGKPLASSRELAAHLRWKHPNCATLVEKLTRRGHLCDVCGKTFQCPALLKDHQLLHTGGRLPCEQCGRLYGSVLSLKLHQVSAHAGNAYRCSVCNKNFSNHTNRLRHQKTVHKTEKTEECGVCGKKFKCLASMISHEKHVHYNVPWPKRNRDRAAERKRRRVETEEREANNE